MNPSRGSMKAQPEAVRLLVRAARPRTTPDVREALLRAVARHTAGELAELAGGLGIAPLVHAHLGCDVDLARGELSNLLKSGRKAAFASSVLLGETYQTIAEVCASESIPLVPLKGIDFAHRLYSSPEVRTMCDIDVLVPEADYARARALFAEVDGFEELLFPHGVGEWEQSAKDAQFVFHISGHAIHVELHRRFGQRYHINVDYDALWRRVICADGGNQGLLSSEDTLLFTAYHLERSLFPTRLLWLVDLLGITSQLEIDWQVVVRRAGHWACRVGLWHALMRVEGTFEERVCPRWVLEALAPGRLQANYLRTIVPPDALVTSLDGTSVRLTQLLFWFPLMDGWSVWRRFVGAYGVMRFRDVMSKWSC